MNKIHTYKFPTKKVDVVNISTRFVTRIDRSDLWKGKPVKQLCMKLSKTGGRNNTGRITVKNIGGGHKQKYRMVDFNRDKFDMKATVVRLEYDPCRSGIIALIKYDDDQLSYILAPQGLQPGMQVISGDNVSPSIGNAMPLYSIPVGTMIHNVQLSKISGKGGSIARSAGSFVTLLGFDESKENAIILLPSFTKLGEKEYRNKKLVPAICMATIGAVSNPDHMNRVYGTAGSKRHMGYKPVVRNRAMNHDEGAHGGNNKRDDRGMRIKRGQKTVRRKNHWYRGKA
jgi:large subunit ribosomal protein L2